MKQPQVSIAVEQYRSQQIFVMGEVKITCRLPVHWRTHTTRGFGTSWRITERAGSEIVVVRPPSGANSLGARRCRRRGDMNQRTSPASI